MPACALLLDDDQAITQLYQEILAEQGIETVRGEMQDMTIPQVVEMGPCLIILDYMFGEEAKGFQFLQQLKLHKATASIPVIVCTAAVKEMQEAASYLESQQVSVLFKPFDVDKFLETVRTCLASSTDTYGWTQVGYTAIEGYALCPLLKRKPRL